MKSSRKAVYECKDMSTLSSKVPWESQTCMEKGRMRAASRSLRTECILLRCDRRACRSHRWIGPSIRTNQPKAGRFLREMKRGERGEGETAAKGDYKEKYSPHSLPTHALLGDYALWSSASLISITACHVLKENEARLLGFQST